MMTSTKTVVNTETRPGVNVTQQECSSCKRMLRSTQFNLDKRRPAGLQAWCKDCTAISSKKSNNKRRSEELDRQQAELMMRENMIRAALGFSAEAGWEAVMARLQAAVHDMENQDSPPTWLAEKLSTPDKKVSTWSDVLTALNDLIDLVRDQHISLLSAAAPPADIVQLLELDDLNDPTWINVHQAITELLELATNHSNINELEMSDMLAEIEDRLSPRHVDVPASLALKYGTITITIDNRG